MTTITEMHSPGPDSIDAREATAQRQGATVAWERDEGESIRLWDIIDGAWTKPLDASISRSVYIRLMTFKCSACKFTAVNQQAVDSHRRSTPTQVEAHKDAKLTPWSEGSRFGTTCTACGVQFAARKVQGQQHLDRLSPAVAEAHKGSRTLYIRRYNLEPVELPESVGDTNGRGESEDIQAERSPRQASGKRRRGRRGGRR